MSATQRINSFLERTVGYRIESARRPAPAQARPEPPKPEPKPEPPAKKPIKFPPDFDGEMRKTIELVREYTMTSNDKLHALVTAVRYVHKYQIPGDIVECGVWRGGSMHTVARTLDNLGEHNRELYLFDTFEGMPPPTEKDKRWDGRDAQEMLDSFDKDAQIWAVASLDDVKAGIATLPYPQERFHFVQGMVEDTIPEHAPEQLAMLRLDTDWYESTRHELEYLYPRLVSGGVLIIDDYGWFQGSAEATDEYFEKTSQQIMLVRAGSGVIGVKP